MDKKWIRFEKCSMNGWPMANIVNKKIFWKLFCKNYIQTQNMSINYTVSNVELYPHYMYLLLWM